MSAERRTACSDDLRSAAAGTGPTELAELLGDFGGYDWDIAWMEDGRLGARPRGGDPRSADPFVVFADSPGEMRELLAAGRPALGSMADAIRSNLRGSGLEVTELVRPGEVMKFVVTNPRRPDEGCITINANGLIEWDRSRQITDRLLATHIASVVVSILAGD